MVFVYFVLTRNLGTSWDSIIFRCLYNLETMMIVAIAWVMGVFYITNLQISLLGSI